MDPYDLFIENNYHLIHNIGHTCSSWGQELNGEAGHDETDQL